MRTELTFLVALISLVAFSQTDSKNYVKTITARQSTTNSIKDSNSSEMTQQSVQYVDGLGRPLQSVIRWASPDEKDIVTPLVYDGFGRESLSYLPYEANQSSSNYRSSAVSELTTYYTHRFGASDGSHPYAETLFEASPLNRVLEQASPGHSWSMDEGNTVRSSYETNSAADAVKLYQFDNLQVSAEGFYEVGELYKTTTTDEDGNAIITYTDKLGLMILKKSYPGSEWAETYYLYDNLLRLRVVIPPQAQQAVKTYYEGLVVDGFEIRPGSETINTNTSNINWAYTFESSITIAPPASGATIIGPSTHIKPIEVLTPDFLSQWAFQYDYDERNRMITKQVPGADPAFMVYDQWDRLVLTQDGEQRKSNQWLYTAYDELNRPVMTGFLIDSRSHNAMQTLVLSYGASSRSLSYTGAGVHGYNTNSYPFVSGSGSTQGDVLTVTYYDDYAFQSNLATSSLQTVDYQRPSHFTAPDATYILPLKSTSTKGQVTGTKTRKLGTSAFIETVSFYDDKYRPIQVVSSNDLNGSDAVSYQYDFVGTVRRSQTEHFDGSNTTRIKRHFDYDHMDRLIKVTHQVNDETAVVLLENDYNEIGELERKDLHYAGANDNPAPEDFEQNVDYGYNIRGWLRTMNNPSLSNGDLFGMELFYNTTSGMSGHEDRFNGNISAMRWSNHDAQADGYSRRGYEFDYDGLNRLTNANHFRNNNTAHAEYDVSVSNYDLNGNIGNLFREGKNGTDLDNLTYTYVGNQLQKVTDASNNAEGFDNGGSGSGTDYTYDANGNMISDANKGITGIEYNHLNLPTKVTFDADNFIEYLYDAAGIKLQQKVYEDGSLTKTTDYVGEFIYEDGAISIIQQEEGRIIPLASSHPEFVSGSKEHDYQYHLKDHLGNVRLTFSTTPEHYSEIGTFEDNNATAESNFFGNYDPREDLLAKQFD